MFSGRTAARATSGFFVSFAAGDHFAGTVKTTLRVYVDFQSSILLLLNGSGSFIAHYIFPMILT